MPSPDKIPNSSTRLHGLDALRAHALLLGVVLHATMSFIPGELGVVVDNSPTPVLSGLWFAIHMFRMATFFLIAGFFARRMIHQRGPLGFARDRLLRVAGPLVVFWLPTFLSVVAVDMWAKGQPMPPFAELFAEFSLPDFPLLHLWFLWLLLLMYVVTLGSRALVVAVDRTRAVRGGLDRVVARLVGPWAAPIMAVPLAIALYRFPDWIIWAGVLTPGGSLIPNTPALVGYGSAFALGFVVHRRPELLQRFERGWQLNLGLAVVAGTGTALLGSGAVPDLTLVPTPEQKAACAALYAVGFFSSTFAAIGLALRYLSAESAVHRYLADASYWIYLVHFSVVLFLQAAVAQLAWPWPLKFGLVLAGTILVPLATYRWLVRGTFIEAFLSGKRHRL